MPNAHRSAPPARRRTLLAAVLAALLSGAAVTGGVLLTTGAGSPAAASDGPSASAAGTEGDPLPSLAAAGVAVEGTPTRKPEPSRSSAPPAAPSSARRTPPSTGGPAALPSGTEFFDDPASQANQWVAAHPDDARRPLIASRIASRPQAVWFATYRPATVTADVRRVTSAASAAGRVPVLVAYEIPDRDCGGASAGGAPDLGGYDAWVRQFAAGLGSRQAVVILEPDSIALVSCLSAAEQSGRYASLARAGADIHAADPQAKVYFDAGHSHWNGVAEQASRLRKAGVLADSDGVYTNVSNFQATSKEVAYAKRLLTALGGSSRLHAVIDTSRNGNGPPAGAQWCDPAGRAIGQVPTTATGDPAIDAFLWVKPPGETDGCAGPAGTFSPGYAAALAGR